MVSLKLNNPIEANISKEITKPLQENEPLAKKIDEGESGLSKPEPVIQTKGRFEIKSNVEKIDVKEKEVEMISTVPAASVPAVSAKATNMNDGATQERVIPCLFKFKTCYLLIDTRFSALLGLRCPFYFFQLVVSPNKRRIMRRSVRKLCTKKNPTEVLI